MFQKLQGDELNKLVIPAPFLHGYTWFCVCICSKTKHVTWFFKINSCTRKDGTIKLNVWDILPNLRIP